MVVCSDEVEVFVLSLIYVFMNVDLFESVVIDFFKVCDFELDCGVFREDEFV